jgi:hypothetical protein
MAPVQLRGRCPSSDLPLGISRPTPLAPTPEEVEHAASSGRMITGFVSCSRQASAPFE